MINTLDDLIELTERLAAEYENEDLPIYFRDHRLRAPGCSAEELAELVHCFPGMPSSYLKLAKRVYLIHTALGYFKVGPHQAKESDTYLDGLRWYNLPKVWYFDLLEPHKLYVVGTHETDLIAVAREGTMRPGQVFVILDYCMPEPRVRPLAWNYEQVLLTFGRVSEACFNKRFGLESIQEVTESVRLDFSFNDQQMDWWETAISRALDEDPADPIELVEKTPLSTNTSKPERSWLPSFLRRSSPN